MDPRLTFDPAFVPIVAGLPSVFEVSDLVLPMNWRHVSWSGCLPIVFDPYHQAFKLTPIGPLPLTHEEVQQNGLAKYVPGGSAHPEAGLLPDLEPLSDGSDETYNFVDVDWVLPWPKGQTFDAMLTGGERMASHGSISPDTDSGPLSGLTAAHTYYVEERDCPDDVVDIVDAWRWLAEKCQDTFTKFEPTAGKSWKGTGIRNTAKKLKQPIASLLASALAETLASPNDFLAPFLTKQNGREFCPLRSVATPVHVNIALLGDTEFTLKELMCYFPSHYMWRKGGDRLVRAGWSAGDISNMINMTRQLSGDATKKNSSVHYAITYEAEKGETGTKTRIVRDEQDDEAQSYTAEGWVYDTLELVDYPVLGLAHGLINLPEGPDAGPLTALIAFCKENTKCDVLLSNVPAMLQEAGISSLIEPGDGACPDKEVWSRHVDLLKDDRKRVLKMERERKRAMEMEEGGKRKRVKTE
ncbi:hypothetical protein BDU57DRAFT_521534 [Ampelomyces quisqualis]|uniref:Uncharacterized protein n=1 Tax=Ampelomyces quisqualis TaxID=50730 RepID=A0A6A5QEL2_AMPQU|nr:hypothetical protein BDU57DRAFT_521534 [Ampelomyces quisqualis]